MYALHKQHETFKKLLVSFQNRRRSLGVISYMNSK